MKKLTFTALLMSILSGCAGTITVQTAPEGALIVSGNQTLGISPHVVTLPSASNNPFSKDAQGCYQAPGFTAKWASGATAASPAPIQLCNGLDGSYVVNIARPADAPGLQEDLAAANQRANVLAKQQEAAAVNNLADTEAMNGAMMMGGPFYGGGYIVP